MILLYRERLFSLSPNTEGNKNSRTLRRRKKEACKLVLLKSGLYLFFLMFFCVSPRLRRSVKPLFESVPQCWTDLCPLDIRSLQTIGEKRNEQVSDSDNTNSCRFMFFKFMSCGGLIKSTWSQHTKSFIMIVVIHLTRKIFDYFVFVNVEQKLVSKIDSKKRYLKVGWARL